MLNLRNILQLVIHSVSTKNKLGYPGYPTCVYIRKV